MKNVTQDVSVYVNNKICSIVVDTRCVMCEHKMCSHGCYIIFHLILSKVEKQMLGKGSNPSTQCHMLAPYHELVA